MKYFTFVCNKTDIPDVSYFDVVFPMYTWAGTVDGVKAECSLLNKIGEEAKFCSSSIA